MFCVTIVGLIDIRDLLVSSTMSGPKALIIAIPCGLYVCLEGLYDHVYWIWTGSVEPNSIEDKNHRLVAGLDYVRYCKILVSALCGIVPGFVESVIVFHLAV